jgi:hypothetical protein
MILLNLFDLFMKFGESQVATKAKLPQIIQPVIRYVVNISWNTLLNNLGSVRSSLASPDSETMPNHLVLVAHNIQNDLIRLDEMKISKSRHIFPRTKKSLFFSDQNFHTTCLSLTRWSTSVSYTPLAFAEL